MHATPEHLTPAPHGNERRAKPRHAPKSLAYVNVGDANGGVIVDISETGMSIASAEPLEPSAATQLRFQLSRIDHTFEVCAEMVWSSDSKTNAGVRFVSMPIDERVRIRNWIKDEMFGAAFPARIASTMVPPRRLPFSFDTMAEASGASASPREPKPRVPAKPLPDIPVAIPSHTQDAFERMFPSESVLGPQIVKRAERARLAPPGEHIDTTALWMNFPSERDVAPRVVEFDESTAVVEDIAPAAAAHIDPPVRTPDEFVSLTPEPVELVVPELREPTDTPVVEEVTAAHAVAEATEIPAIEGIPHIEFPMSAPVESIDTAMPATSQPVAPIVVEELAPTTTTTEASVAPEVARATANEAAPAAALELTPRSLSISEFELPPPVIEPSAEESPEVPVHELHPAPEGPAFAASLMDAVEISQAVRSPGKFSGGAVSDASVESLLAIAEAEEDSLPPPRKPLRVVRDQKSSQSSAAMPPQQAVKIAPVAATVTPLPHVALRSAAQRSTLPQKLVDGDKQFHGLLIAAALVFLALCFVIGYSHNVQLPWMHNASKSSNGAPTNIDPAQAAPSAAPATDSAPSPSSQTEQDASATSQATVSTPATNDASQSQLPDSASIEPSAKFEAPALPATPTPPPPSYFPVTAPAGGSAPRMIELPEKTVFDSPKVLIQLRQFFYVPAQPGPEWSHKLGQILVGEPMLKMPPPPASDADSSVVHVRATFGKDGAVKNVRPIDGPVALLPRAVDAVRQWRYQPSVLDGQPVEWQGDFTIEFRPAS